MNALGPDKPMHQKSRRCARAGRRRKLGIGTRSTNRSEGFIVKFDVPHGIAPRGRGKCKYGQLRHIAATGGRGALCKGLSRHLHLGSFRR